MNEATIIETSDGTFELDVLERSQLQPVVVDFWAEWCQPCRMIAPVLEKIAAEFAGRVTVVKANTDHCQAAASNFGVSGIPAIFGVLDQQVVDALQGAVSEEMLRLFFRRLVAAGEIQSAQAAEEESPQRAIELYRQMLTEDEENVHAKIGLGRCLLSLGDIDAAREILESLESRGYLETEAEQLKSKLALLTDIPSQDIDQLRSQVQQQPRDLDLKIELARSLAAKQDYAEALELALEVVVADSGSKREESRLLMIDIFRALPDDSPLTSDYRKQLAMALY
ncbi:MAG: tetratricopeptide repeat protein [Pirellulaceae bacterium]